MRYSMTFARAGRGLSIVSAPSRRHLVATEPTMSTTADLVAALKTELKASGLTYAALAERLGVAESSVKRMFSARGDMPLSRIDAICRALNLDFADLARSVADKAPLLAELSLAQEMAVVGDRIHQQSSAVQQQHDFAGT